MSLTTEQFAERVFASALGSIEMYSIYIGDRLGYYRVLAGRAVTASQLATATKTDERYAREWLEQQSASGILDVDLSGADPVFTLPIAHRPVLTEATDSNYLAPMTRMLTAAGGQLPDLLEAYRSGGGVPWDRYGPDMRESQADMNRPFFQNELADVFGRLGRVHELLSKPNALAADVGCGAGWSTIHLARAYPNATLNGFDIDAVAIEMARRNAEAEGVADRVTFSSDNIAEHPVDAHCDVVLAFECIHDMPRPVRVLRAMRSMLRDDGICVVMDEAVGESFAGPSDDVERLMYGFSLLVCLPDGRSSRPSVATGTVMRPSVLRGYALDAGFSDCAPIAEAGFFRFYELTP
ncbi:class I SAM-dependent methyltransferase [Cryobacterium sp. BB307]|uniref:class I SAM-dependent methyltransferase n=1 Tax=Cryobacterium sp. BB307 TaxID=2716317 RepID=UPI0032C153E9